MLGTRRCAIWLRARLDAVHSLRRGAPAALRFFVAPGVPLWPPAWTKLHRRWLAGLKFDQAVHHIVLEDYIARSKLPRYGADRCDGANRDDAAGMDAGSHRGALQTMRGMALVNAAS